MKTINTICKAIGLLIGIVTVVSLFNNCSSRVNNYSPDILIDQVGYLNNAPKMALIRSYQGKFTLVDTYTNKTVYKGKASDTVFWNSSNEWYAVADFSEVIKSGVYQLRLENNLFSAPIYINNTYPDSLFKATLKAFYYTRATMPIDSKFGASWAREAGHPDTAVIIHESAGGVGRKAGDYISSPGGWYDAGDYNKYIVNSAISVYTLLSAYDLYSKVIADKSLNIPESDNLIPDILDETCYNVKWMLSMQDSDGGVYHKLTTKKFEGFVMPQAATEARYVVMKTTAATLDFAASMAACARIVEDVDSLVLLAGRCRESAIRAWNWALKNPEVYYIQPPDIQTGQYNDTSLSDEWLWASAELYLLTMDRAYLRENEVLNPQFPYTTPSWDLVQTLGLLSLVANPSRVETDILEKSNKMFLNFVDTLYAIYAHSPALVSLEYFKWGSNSDLANQSVLASVAYRLTGSDKYAWMALDNLHYLLGRNPVGYCFVTGFGYQSPMYIHHRPSGADGIEKPVPGFLVGGPNTIVLNDCGDSVSRSKWPACSYTDSECSYSTNEVAINWNAPMVFALAATLDFLHNQDK
ncbi:MAG: glycoside hydrolase family 9 protein [Bacteroidota bacterium]|nr:MAG: glycoside hydrolase family 9 protein [Bacteroidota bacterium]